MIFSEVSCSATLTGLAAALEQLPRDHQPLDLAGALADGAQLRVAIKLLDRIVFREPVAAVTCTASFATRTATSDAYNFAMADSLFTLLPWSFIHAARCVKRRAASISVAMSASLC
jgi:hypothetical protein